MINKIVDFYQNCTQYAGPIYVDPEQNPNFFQAYKETGTLSPNGLQVIGRFTACHIDQTRVSITVGLVCVMVALVVRQIWACCRK